MNNLMKWILVGLVCMSAVVFFAHKNGLFNTEQVATVPTTDETASLLENDGVASNKGVTSPSQSEPEVALQPLDPRPIDPDIQSLVDQFYDAPTATEAALALESVVIDEENEAHVMTMRASLGMACSEGRYIHRKVRINGAILLKG